MVSNAKQIGLKSSSGPTPGLTDFLFLFSSILKGAFKEFLFFLKSLSSLLSSNLDPQVIIARNRQADLNFDDPDVVSRYLQAVEIISTCMYHIHFS